MGRLVLIILVLFSVTAIYSEASATGHRQVPTTAAGLTTGQMQATRSLGTTGSQHGLTAIFTD